MRVNLLTIHLPSCQLSKLPSWKLHFIIDVLTAFTSNINAIQGIFSASTLRIQFMNVKNDRQVGKSFTQRVNKTHGPVYSWFAAAATELVLCNYFIPILK